MVIVVTGATGYIGGQISLMLKDAGHTVIGIDRRPCAPHLTAQRHRTFDMYCQEDFASDVALDFITYNRPSAIIHCAGTSLVGPSMKNPKEYWNNNVSKTQILLDRVVNDLPETRVIFSSSAAVYGEPVMTPCYEADPKDPLSPYGQTKLTVEWMLESYHRAYNLQYVAFRYFNACGADSTNRHGQESNATHIIARVLESVRDSKEFMLYGENYPTEDGTCVRDYVHVEDIARAHLAALDTAVVPSGVYNLGSSMGHSNRQIISTAEEITKTKVNVTAGPARAGDPATLTAESGAFDRVVPNWRQYNLHDIITHAWKWYR